MGSGLVTTGGPLSLSETERVVEDSETLYPADYQNTLRLHILDGIPLKFHRPTNIILYGCPYSQIEHMGQFLSEKLKCDINRGEISEPNHQNLFINYPSTFQESLALRNLTPEHETIAIFIRCHLRGLYFQIRHQWIHQPSGRRYNTVTSPPKSMTGTPDEPETMFDDLTGEPLDQEVPTDVFFQDIRTYEVMRQEMWPHWISFRHAVDGDASEDRLKSSLVRLLSNTIAHQPPAMVRVMTPNGVKVFSTHRRRSTDRSPKSLSPKDHPEEP
jgi:hypothetical protein